MRRVRQIVLTLCVLLTLATIALWYRTCRHAGEIFVWDSPPSRHYELTWIPGQVRSTAIDGWVAPQPPRHFARSAPPCYPVLGQKVLYPKAHTLGTYMESRSQIVYYGPGGTRLNVAYRLAAVPMAIPAVLFGFYPAWEVLIARRRRLRREKRLANGLCVRCGYDLRATPDRCPECGEAISTARA